MFNISVECGQVLFPTAVLAAMFALRKLPVNFPEPARRAAFWTIERVVAIIFGCRLESASENF
jgi:hypothetical protein